jgi:NADH dehydrogenase
VVLIDKFNYHCFQPLLYQVATAGLEPGSIGYPLRKIFQHREEFYFRMSEVLAVNTENNEITTSIGPLSYDHLVLATGSATNFFGNKRLEEGAMGMKTIPQALDIRSQLLQNFEKALLSEDLKERESLMNVVIVGAGPTGVELAGAIAELRNHVLPNDYPDLDFRRMGIKLVEAGDRVLAGMSEISSKKASQYLKKLGVELWFNTSVKDYDGKLISTSGKPIPAQTMIWAAGVHCMPPNGISGEAMVRGNRMQVDEFNRVKGYQNVYAIGDVAYMPTEKYPSGHPMVAQPAIQQGRNLGKNLVRGKSNKAWKPFKYSDLGSMATIGRTKAVTELPGWKSQGALAWFVWIFVHLMALVGFRNRLVVLISWSYNFFNYNRDIRLIIRPFDKIKPGNPSLVPLPPEP